MKVIQPVVIIIVLSVISCSTKKAVLPSDTQFQYCITFVLQHEGGLSLDKRDPGGATQWGISLRFLRAIGLDIDRDGDVDPDDIINLTKPMAIDIYKKHWWDEHQYSRFLSDQVSCKVLDLSVNMGPKAAHKLLQTAINRVDANSVLVDGILGDRTFSAANLINGERLREELRTVAKEKYSIILANNAGMEWARNGWMTRSQW